MIDHDSSLLECFDLYCFFYCRLSLSTRLVEYRHGCKDYGGQLGLWSFNRLQTERELNAGNVSPLANDRATDRKQVIAVNPSLNKEKRRASKRKQLLHSAIKIDGSETRSLEKKNEVLSKDQTGASRYPCRLSPLSNQCKHEHTNTDATIRSTSLAGYMYR